MTNETGNSDIVSVSIIIPVYNAEDYIGACLDSIGRQDFSGVLEVILIDDCSRDASAQICRDWVQRYDQNSQLIEHRQNQGISVTRNHGLEAATGNYFMFVDADDLLPVQAVSALVEAAESAGADIVKGNNTIFDDTRDNAARYNVDKSVLIRGDEILATLFEHQKLRGHPWGKLFDRQKFGDIRFSEDAIGSEDLVFCSEAFSRASSLFLLNETVYNYRSNESGAAAKKYQSGVYIGWLDAVDGVAKFCRCQAHRRAHKELLIRTITQLAREARELPPRDVPRILNEIEKRKRQWGISWIALLAGGNLKPSSIGRLVKMYLALYRIRRNLSDS